MPRWLVTLPAALLLFLAAGCGGGGSEALPTPPPKTPVVQWSEELNNAISSTTTGPTVAARAIAIVHTAMFDAWAAYDSRAVGTQYFGALRRPAAERTPANRAAAVSYAAHRALLNLFPSERNRFDGRLNSLGYPPVGDFAPDSPAAVGRRAADAVLAFRATDGANQDGSLGGGPYGDYTGYQPANTVDQINDPNRWQPLRFSDGQTPGFLTPHWSRVRPFAVENGQALRPAAPPLYPDPRYKARADEILNITANLNEQQKVIADYWAKNGGTETPPGQWAGFAQYVSRRDRHTLDDDVKMFFILGNALLDASICCWDAKIHYDFARPITAIRFLYRGQTIRGWGGPGRGTVDMRGEDWVPYQPSTFVSPPFAEYTSGHSTFSAASAEVLARFTGSDRFGLSATIRPGENTIEPGVTPSQTITLSWPTFSAAADQAGLSRRYGGIHFADGDANGRTMGRQIGRIVFEKAQLYINGTARPGP